MFSTRERSVWCEDMGIRSFLSRPFFFQGAGKNEKKNADDMKDNESPNHYLPRKT